MQKKVSETEKEELTDLAVFGGNPLFPNPLHVNRPNTGDRAHFLTNLEKALDNHIFTNDGPFVRELERRLEKYLGVKNCIVTSNGTLALLLTVKALNLAGEVIIPSFTFVSTPHTLHLSNIRPIFCDISNDDLTIDPESCKKLITTKTSAIIGTHIFGRSCQIKRLQKIADEHNIYLLFDAAHAFGCNHDGKMIGQFGEAEIFSFHATKVFHTFEGGAVTTNSDRLADRVRKMRNFGFVGYDQTDGFGINAKMTEVSAAMGLTNLQSIDDFITINKENHDLYARKLTGIPGLVFRRFEGNEKNNYQYICIEISEKEFGISRDELIAILHGENILARRYFYPGTHNLEPYASLYPKTRGDLSITDDISLKILILPSGTGIRHSEINKICSIIRFVKENVTSINLKMREKKLIGKLDS